MRTIEAPQSAHFSGKVAYGSRQLCQGSLLAIAAPQLLPVERVGNRRRHLLLPHLEVPNLVGDVVLRSGHSVCCRWRRWRAPTCSALGCSGRISTEQTCEARRCCSPTWLRPT